MRFSEAVAPPAGRGGTEVLRGLAEAFGVEVPGDIAAHVEQVVGVARDLQQGKGGAGRQAGGLVAAGAEAKPARVQPPLTVCERYKREIREVGTERFRVR